ncbi:MAG: trigger factor [Solirubrobacterales bacterium]|nr:trigger factor [Solirubrobacterales bacterium]
MAGALKTTVTELPESRVRVQAEVAPEEVQRSLESTARKLGAEMRIPGFRKGKVPPPVIIQRIGREAVLDETVRGGLTGWYVRAIDESGISPVGDPQLDIGDLPAEGQPLTFSIEIGVRPPARLGTYKGVEVGRREPQVQESEIDAEIEALRERLARLDTVDRAAGRGDFVTMDYLGTLDGEPFEGGEGRDQVVELGSGKLIEGFEDGILGATAGEDRTVDVTFPDDYGAELLAGRDAQFAITVKEVKAKELPDLDDDFASDAAGFDTLAGLREDIGTRLREADEKLVETEFREAALDAVVAESQIDLPAALVDARAQELLERLMHQLGHQGIDRATYLQISGKTEEEMLDEARPDAEQTLRREAVLDAIVEAEGIAPSDEELLEALGTAAEREGMSAEKLRDRLRSAGRLDTLAQELAASSAIDVVAEAATPITVEQAQARDKLWTPEKEASDGGGEKLWTPGS